MKAKKNILVGFLMLGLSVSIIGAEGKKLLDGKTGENLKKTGKEVVKKVVEKVSEKKSEKKTEKK